MCSKGSNEKRGVELHEEEEGLGARQGALVGGNQTERSLDGLLPSHHPLLLGVSVIP